MIRLIDPYPREVLERLSKGECLRYADGARYFGEWGLRRGGAMLWAFNHGAIYSSSKCGEDIGQLIEHKLIAEREPWPGDTEWITRYEITEAGLAYYESGKLGPKDTLATRTVVDPVTNHVTFYLYPVHAGETETEAAQRSFDEGSELQR